MSEDKAKPFSPFDPARLAMPSTGADAFGVRRIISTIPVGKPKGKEWVRVHEDSDYHLCAALLDLEDGDPVYLVTPDIAAALGSEVKPVNLGATMTRQGKLFLWPCPIIQSDRQPNSWHTPHVAAFERSKTQWIRMTSDRSVGAYNIYEAEGFLPPPVWPELSLLKMLEIAFGDGHLIDRDDHPALKRLKGGL